MGRFLSQKDMSAAKYASEANNSRRNRNEIKSADKVVREMHVVCGCGVEGCIFIHLMRNETEEERNIRLS